MCLYPLASFSNFIDDTSSWNMLILGIVFLVVILYSFYSIIGSFKMKKKAGYGLIFVLLCAIAYYLFVAFYQKPVTDEQKAGAGWSLISVAFNLISLAVVAFSLKKMK